MPTTKTTISDLAVFGGTPSFDRTLHVGGPNIGDRQAFFARLEGMLDRAWLTNDGPLVRELETRIAELLDVRHCVAMCNATVALEIAIRALGLEGEVIVPSFTFVATAHALWWQGIRPVFCDIDPLTHCIDAAEVERRVTPRTTGILGVHVWGRGCDVQALEAVAERHRLKLLFDAAHAFGVSHQGRMIGAFGRCEVLSFHATKFFNALEGGAIVTNDGELAAKTRLMRNFGFSGLDNVIYIGTNGKMTEAAAAMGLTNLDSLPSILDANRRNYLAYREASRLLPGVRLFAHDESERRNFQYVVFEIDADFGLTRDQLVRVLHAEGVRARRYFWPGCHRMEPYRTDFPDPSAWLPRTEQVARRVLVMPTGSQISVADVERIAGLLHFVAESAPAISRRLGDDDQPDSVALAAGPNPLRSPR